MVGCIDDLASDDTIWSSLSIFADITSNRDSLDEVDRIDGGFDMVSR